MTKQNAKLTPEQHGRLVDVLTAEGTGATFIQGDNAGRIWVKSPDGTVLSITAEVQLAPLPDLTGKKKLSTPDNPATAE